MSSLFDKADEIRIVPCTITAVGPPLVVTVLGTGGINGVPLKGVTYSNGAANALISKVGAPIILQIGP